jgi:hypothetical protein
MLLHKVFLVLLFPVGLAVNDRCRASFEIIVVVVAVAADNEDDRTDAENSGLESNVAIDIIRIKFLFMLFTLHYYYTSSYYRKEVLFVYRSKKEKGRISLR